MGTGGVRRSPVAAEKLAESKGFRFPGFISTLGMCGRVWSMGLREHGLEAGWRRQDEELRSRTAKEKEK